MGAAEVRVSLISQPANHWEQILLAESPQADFSKVFEQHVLIQPVIRLYVLSWKKKNDFLIIMEIPQIYN